ncbi:Similar to S.cerevisiae protein NUP100 (FG-nucleoporin component of central core of the nuclear pore complex) [Malassezia sympodialis ATCC 42132]|uniref:Similar to S.cerevisiae protein NUP100 (FG-nucleoporin component of central core of the nuclear pore complex) n=1 Tax=Malassezia sympodialis (strain ATCC 42132) TaxID=1230383 RepID=A0A1M8A229_MALS4|nr:Similar to S.cerevisiae protein NUP100 (FG-nucleoporin component of central core of the nuclear pore complex) [Malassezia sympodialis ATCC 42132]
MFGSSSFGGFGQQNQQGVNNASQPSGTGMFGQPAPAAGAGTGSMFGQPAATSAFGTPAFGQPATGTAFGSSQTPAFGANNSMQSAPMNTPFSFNQSSTSSFGAPKPATTGFGGFGASTPSMPAQTGTSFGFGGASTPVSQPPTSTFGAPNTASTGFGQANTSFFGQPSSAPTPAFGGFGGGMAGVSSVTQGSATVPYAPFREDMTPNEPKAHAKTFEVHQSLTSMPAYQSMSPEELRLMDYQQGRGKGTAGPSALGTAAGSAPGTTSAPSFGFGAQPSSFGAQAAPSSTPGFGQASTTNAFGQPASGTGTGLFGQPATSQMNSGTSLFGAQNNTATAGTGGLFGQNKPSTFGASTTTPMFGAQNNAGGTGSGSLFGSGSTGAQTAPSSGFSFGANNANTPSTGFSFGANNNNATQNNQSKPLFGGFGSSTTQPAQPPSTGFSFGASTTQPAQPPSTGSTFGSGGTGFSFGANNNNAPKPGGLFGNSSSQPSTAPTFGGFGANNNTQAQANKPAFSFGSSNTNTGTGTGTGFGAPAAGAAGGFGASTTTNNAGGGLFGAKPPGTSLFGNSASQPSAGSTSTGGFGASSTTNNAGGGLFGAKPPGTSLFGNNNASQPAAGGTSLFGNTGAAGAASSAPSTGGGLFGNNTTNNAAKPAFSFGQSTTAGTGTSSGGLFGQSQPASGTAPSLFGQSQPAGGAGASGGLFGAKPLGASAPAPGASVAPPTLTTNPYGTDALLSQVPTTAANQSPLPFNVAPKNKPPLVPPFRSSPRNAVRVTRLRGSTPGLDMSRSVREGTPVDRTTPVRAGSVGLFRNPSDAAVLPSQAFIPRSTSKRLVLDADTSLTQSPSLRASVPRAVTPRARFSPAVEKVVAGGIDGDTSLVVPTHDASVLSSTPAPKAKASVASATELRPPRPAQKGDYFTEPSLAALRSMPFDELAQVSDFVVGRVGFGQVTFLEPVDLTSVPDLSFVAGGVVQLRAKECFVYPQEEDLESDEPLDGLLPHYVPVPKAPLGTGLNVPARVSLEGCWPVDRATREPLKDEQLPRVKQHIHKLRNKKETDFVSYDAVSGTWTFNVPHFSRYGLDDSDEEMDGAPGADDDMHDEDDDAPPPMALGEESGSDESDMHESELGADRADDMEADVWVPTVPAAMPLRRSMTPGAAMRTTPGPEARKVQVMRASFFGQAPPTTGPVGGVSHGPWMPPPSVPPSSVTEAELMPDADVLQEAELGVIDPVPPARPPVPLVRVDAEHTALDTSATDPGLAWARATRAGWGPRGLLVHQGTVGRATQGDSLTQVHMAPVPAYTDPDAQAQVQALSRLLLERQLAHTERRAGELAPSVSFRQGTTCADIAQLYGVDDKQYAAQLWHLASALFDPLDLALPATPGGDAPDAALVAHVTQRRRKAALSAWLERAVAASVQAEVRAHTAASRSTEQVFALLSGHQVEEAAEAAMESGQVRLATLVAQAGGSLEMRADLQEQLAVWRSEGVDAEVDTSVRRVYELLAGNVTHAQMSDARGRPTQTLAMAAGLDWRRALGLHVWYGTAWEAPLAVSLRSYEAAWRESDSTAAPLPPYQADAQLGLLRKRELIQRPGAPRDALFELLMLHVDASYPLEHALEPRHFGRSALDHTLPWHLLMYLSRALGVRSLDDATVGERLTTAYAAQLEASGEWHWAAFVLLHLTDEAVRQRAVQALLTRHVAHLDEHASWLQTELCLPDTWLWAARATASHAQGDYFAEYEHRLRANDMSGAHAIAVRYLAAEAFVRGDTQVLIDLFSPMAEAAEAPVPVPVQGWNDGGRVFLDYAMLPQKLPTLLAQARSGTSSANERHALQQAIHRTHELLERVPRLYPDTTDLMSTVARTEMLAVLHNLARLLASEAGAAEPTMHWTPAHPPEVEQLQSAARDFGEALLAGL